MSEKLLPIFHKCFASRKISNPRTMEKWKIFCTQMSILLCLILLINRRVIIIVFSGLVKKNIKRGRMIFL